MSDASEIRKHIDKLNKQADAISNLFGFEGYDWVDYDITVYKNKLYELNKIEEKYNKYIEALSSGVPNLTRNKYDRFAIPVFIFDNPTAENSEKYIIEVKIRKNFEDLNDCIVIEFYQFNEINNRDMEPDYCEYHYHGYVVCGLVIDDNSVHIVINNRLKMDNVFNALIRWIINNKIKPELVERYNERIGSYDDDRDYDYIIKERETRGKFVDMFNFEELDCTYHIAK
jgi:hypothetical protein